MKLTKYDREAIIRAIEADIPKPNKAARKTKLQADIVKHMSPECRKIFKRTPAALTTEYVGDLIYTGGWGDSRAIVIGDCPKDTVKALIEPYKAEDDARYSTLNRLNAAINACTTLKQLNDRLPEFAKYFPTEQQPTKNLPAIANLVADLTKLGWPKTTQPKETANA